MTDARPAEFQRFNVTFRIQHVILLVAFLLLAFTGWALKYPEPALQHTGWWIRLWGGAKTAGIIHRVAGVIMLIDFAWHVLYMVYMLLSGKMKFDPVTTIVPVPSDIKNAVQNILYFLGLGDTKPKFGRYNYIQKFDYWAVFWGVSIIGASGLLLWFPTFFARYMPGWIFNVAILVHSDEALLAVGFIFTIHFFNSNLRPEKFPMDPVIFTGRLEEEEFRRDHPEEYERLRAEGRLESRRADPPPRWLRNFSLVVGLSSLAIGLVLIWLIIATALG